MGSIIAMSLVAVAGLVAVSQYYSYAPVAVSNRSRVQYMFLTFSVAAMSVVAIVLNVIYPHPAGFVLYALERFLKVLIMGETILLSENMVEIDKKYISIFISVVSYSAVFLFFIDTVMQGGRLERGEFGIYFDPVAPWHQAIYFVYYVFYVVILIMFIVYKGAAVYRKSEKKDLLLLLLVYAFSAAGFISEQFIIVYRLPYIPIVIVFSLISAIIMRKLLIYHDSITLSPSHFEKEFDKGRTDVVFILDNQLKIVYQNKRAEVLSQLLGDEFVGRKLNEVFSFSPSAYSQIIQDKDENAFGISADYPAGDRHVNMVINHKLDSFGDVLATIVYVYNMEEFEKAGNLISDLGEESGEEMIRNALRITKDARILIVDDDIIFLNVFQRLLKPYEVEVTRAASGKDALTAIENHAYDIIFISYEMENGGGTDIVTNIRNTGGDYCRNVPIVFTTTADINDVFVGFLEAGFNDYLEKPVSRRALNSVLTRWLWVRLEDENSEDVQKDNRFLPQYNELNTLANDAEKMYSDRKYEMFGYCVKGIEKNSKRLGLNDISDLSSELEEAIMFEDFQRMGQLFNKLRAGIRDAITIR